MALTPGDARRDRSRLAQVRAAVEATPLAPGLPLMRDARTTLDVGALETADVKANARAAPTPGSSSLGASDATGGIDRSRGASTFYFEYDAPPFVAVVAVPAEGALYACFVVAADQHAKSDDVRTLREVTESFRVGRCANAPTRSNRAVRVFFVSFYQSAFYQCRVSSSHPLGSRVPFRRAPS